MPSHTLFLSLPGWLSSGPLHWQSRWEALHGDTRVQQSDWQRPLRGDWCARLDEVIADHLAAQSPAPGALLKNALPTPNFVGLEASLTDKKWPETTPIAPPSIVLVAHSLGCHLVAAWAAASRHTAAVRCALLVAPPDALQADFPPDLFNWRKPILQKLPFPALCVLSSNDPFCGLATGRATAAAWGASTFEIGPHDHLNSDSGLGDWPSGRALLADLINSAELPNTAQRMAAAPVTAPLPVL